MKTKTLGILLALAISPGYAQTAGTQTGNSGNSIATGQGGGGGGGGSFGAGGESGHGGGGRTVGGGGGVSSRESSRDRGSIIKLITYPEVERDLAYSPEQKVAVKTITQRVEEFEKRLHAESMLPPVAHPHKMGLRHKQNDQAASLVLARARQDIGKALTPGQMKRLEQISLQELGAEALSRSNIVKALNLTQEQQQTLAEIRLETGRELSVMDQRFQEAFFPKWAQPPLRGSRQAGGDVPSDNQFAQGTASTSVSAAPGGKVTVRSASGGGGRSGGGTFILTPAHQKMMDEARAQHQAVVQQSERRMIEEVLTPQQQAKLKELQGKPCPISLPGLPQTP